MDKEKKLEGADRLWERIKQTASMDLGSKFKTLPASQFEPESGASDQKKLPWKDLEALQSKWG